MKNLLERWNKLAGTNILKESLLSDEQKVEAVTMAWEELISRGLSSSEILGIVQQLSLDASSYEDDFDEEEDRRWREEEQAAYSDMWYR